MAGETKDRRPYITRLQDRVKAHEAALAEAREEAGRLIDSGVQTVLDDLEARVKELLEERRQAWHEAQQQEAP